MTDIRIVDDKGIEAPVTSPQPMKASTVEGDVMTPLLERAIGNVLGLEKDSEFGRYQDKINTLLSYAKSQTDDHSPENLKWIIRSLEMKLGSPPLAEKRISFVARYAWLLQEESKLKKEKEAFERI
jgi:hypothetical protein